MQKYGMDYCSILKEENDRHNKIFFSQLGFSTFYEKKVDKSTILHSKSCFFLISLRSITNLEHDFKSPFLDIEITISTVILFFFFKL